MANKLTKNMGLKILSVLIAAVLWLVATNINDPVTKQTYNVTVTIKNLDTLTSKNKFVEVLDGTDNIKVTLRAARSVLAEVSDKNITAVADAEKITDGNYIPIELTCNKGNIEGDSIKPDKEYVRVNVENVRRRQLPITVAVDGTPAEGYMLGGTSTAQNAVMLSGPESIVNTVSSVSVEIDADGATSDVNISLPIHLYDSTGEEITDPRITKSISNVSTTAIVWMVKSVPIEYSYEGEVAEGYQIDGNLRSTLNYIMVAGKPSVLKNLQKIEVNDVIDITNATRNVEETIDLKKRLPEGIVFAEADAETKATISLNISKIPVEEEEDGNEEE